MSFKLSWKPGCFLTVGGVLNSTVPMFKEPCDPYSRKPFKEIRAGREGQIVLYVTTQGTGGSRMLKVIHEQDIGWIPWDRVFVE